MCEKLCNIEKSGIFVLNERENNIHIQTFICNDARANVFYLHGYAAHGNRPILKKMSEDFNSKGLSFITFDFHAHGHSETNCRAFLENYDYLVNDALCVILNHYTKNKNIPFYIIGHSCGGGVGILLSHIFTEETKLYSTKYYIENKEKIDNIGTYFKGLIMLCPVIKLTYLSDICIHCFDRLASWIPKFEIPKIMFDEDILVIRNWKDQEYIKYVFEDGYPYNMEGLSYGGNIKFKTLATILNMSLQIQSIIKTTHYPWLIFHDPHDIIVMYGGSKLFYDKSPSMDKNVIDVHNGLHDLMVNEYNSIMDTTLQWIHERL